MAHKIRFAMSYKQDNKAVKMYCGINKREGAMLMHKE